MTRLLVSVRDVDEAVAAWRGGADLIDVKEPAHGSLGAATPATWRAIRAALAGGPPMSAALGEWYECGDATATDELAGYSFAKVGLAGAADVQGWEQAWCRIVHRLPDGVAPVAVAYADWRRAASPPPDTVLQVGAEIGCPVVLCDTHDKRYPLFHWWSSGEVARWQHAARELGMRVALAGSLDLPYLAEARALCPDWIAVRGAACVGGREGRVCEQRVARLSRCLRTAAPIL